MDKLKPRQNVTDLRPCPFCGKKAVTIKLQYGDGIEYFGVTCEGYTCPCSSIIPNFDTEERAIEAWNRRAEE